MTGLIIPAEEDGKEVREVISTTCRDQSEKCGKNTRTQEMPIRDAVEVDVDEADELGSDKAGAEQLPRPGNRAYKKKSIGQSRQNTGQSSTFSPLHSAHFL